MAQATSSTKNSNAVRLRNRIKAEQRARECGQYVFHALATLENLNIESCMDEFRILRPAEKEAVDEVAEHLRNLADAAERASTLVFRLLHANDAAAN